MPKYDLRKKYLIKKQNLPIKDLLKHDITGSMIKWRLGIAFNYKERQSNIFKCPC